MKNKTIKVINGNLANKNPFSEFHTSSTKHYFLSGEFRGQKETIQIADNDLAKGILFLGNAGQGKTNTMLALASQILENLDDNDLVIFFDLKGDYQKTFFQSGDFILTATNDKFVWNIFDELTPFIGNNYMLEMRIKELCQYLYKGRQSQEPYAREVTECIIKYFLFSANETGDYSTLNNKEFKNFIKGNGYGYEDTYDQIRELLTIYDEFKSALSYIPPREVNDRSAYGVISEITSMVNDVFSAVFGASDFNDGEYISAAKFVHGKGSQVIYLAYNPALISSQVYVFRYFVDNIIANRCDYFFVEDDYGEISYTKKSKNYKCGKTYIFLDEFARLPKLEYLSLALGQLRGLGVSIIGGLQNTDQIYMTYKESESNAILAGFQSVIAFNCGEKSIKFFQLLTGSARVQDRFQQTGGSIAYSPPYECKCVEDRDIISLIPGETIVKLINHKPFKFRFSLNRII
ncbi:type IV secretion system DNA-binding domain-containing protein [Lachnospiraceae bacterium 48-33]